MTDVESWQYVDSANNPADDITQGLSLEDLRHPHRWQRRPEFLYHPPEHWPAMPVANPASEEIELRKSAFIDSISFDPVPQLPDVTKFTTSKELLQTTAQCLHGAAEPGTSSPCEANDYINAEKLLLMWSQRDSFPDEMKAFQAGCSLPPDSRLGSLAPEYDDATGLLRVVGRLRLAEALEMETIHPIILDPHYFIIKLLIQDFGQTLLYPGPE